jgi:acetyl esterase
MNRIFKNTVAVSIIIAAVVFLNGCILFKIVGHQGPTEKVEKVENLKIPSGDTTIRVRIFTPVGNGPFPILLYSHGGGWMRGDVYTHGKVCRYLANKVGCIVVSVDYRKAPKNKFPIPVEDAYAALQWTVQHAAQLDGDPVRVAVGGDSAGGNISAAVCLMAKERGGPKIIFQLLVYPATDLSSLDTESYRKYGTGYDLTKAHVEKCRDKYLRTIEDRTNPYASPLLAKDLSKLPPALIITGEYDVVRDEGEAYAKRLQQAGVQARSFRCPEIGHGAAYWAVASGLVQNALDEAVSALRQAFSNR